MRKPVLLLVAAVSAGAVVFAWIGWRPIPKLDPGLCSYTAQDCERECHGTRFAAWTASDEARAGCAQQCEGFEMGFGKRDTCRR